MITIKIKMLTCLFCRYTFPWILTYEDSLGDKRDENLETLLGKVKVLSACVQKSKYRDLAIYQLWLCQKEGH